MALHRCGTGPTDPPCLRVVVIDIRGQTPVVIGRSRKWLTPYGIKGRTQGCPRIRTWSTPPTPRQSNTPHMYVLPFIDLPTK